MSAAAIVTIVLWAIIIGIWVFLFKATRGGRGDPLSKIEERHK